MVLLIGYGNTLLGDDGVGQAIALAVAARRPDIEVVTTHQLVPELAAQVAAATQVVFVDASRGDRPGAVHCGPVRADGPVREGHILTPMALMALTRAAFGWEPPAWLVTIEGRAFDIGSPISEVVAAAVPGAIEQVLALLSSADQTRTA
ncbi:MAG: hydrogenase maturation protease [Vicinamibacterales bacterium]